MQKWKIYKPYANKKQKLLSNNIYNQNILKMKTEKKEWKNDDIK